MALNLSRNQLAQFLKSHEQIRQFELLFSEMNALIENGAGDASLEIGIVDAKANDALAQLQRIADSLDMLASAPLPQEFVAQDDFAPPIAPALVQDDFAPPVVCCPENDWLLPPERQFRNPRYGAFYDTTIQTAAAPDTAYPVSFDTTSLARGVSIVGGTQITVDTAGLYSLLFAVSFHETSGGTHDVWAWAALNGTDIPASAAHVVIQGNGAIQAVPGRILLELAAGDYLEVMWATSSTNVQVEGDAATAFAPLVPSAVCSITDHVKEF